MAEWRARNAELIAAYQAANPHVGKNRAARRRARKHQNGVFDVTARDLHRILVRQRNECALCGDRMATVEWDHILPISRGGGHRIGNLQALCLPCNRRKNRWFLSELRWRDAGSSPQADESTAA